MRPDVHLQGAGMAKVAKLATRLNGRGLRPGWQSAAPHVPRFFLFTDQQRLSDPAPLLAHLPRHTAIVLRDPDSARLYASAQRLLRAAHRLGMIVLIGGDVRMALALGCDGVHLSQARAHRGPLRMSNLPPHFLITAAAHDGPSLRRAARCGARAAVLSPVFATQSHVGAKGLGALRFARLARLSTLPVVALGGITPATVRRVALGPIAGIGAIGGWLM